jgi:hypothetical protein
VVHFSLYFKIWDFLLAHCSAHRHNLLTFGPGAIVNLGFCREIVLDLSYQEDLVEMLGARAPFFCSFGQRRAFGLSMQTSIRSRQHPISWLAAGRRNGAECGVNPLSPVVDIGSGATPVDL